MVDALRAELRRRFDSGLPDARLSTSRDGAVLRISLPTASLFGAGQSALRADKRAAVAELGRALAAVPSGVAFRIEISLPRGADAAAGPGLPIARAGALARHLAGEGVAPVALATGLRPGAGGDAQFTVFVRADDGRAGAARD